MKPKTIKVTLQRDSRNGFGGQYLVGRIDGAVSVTVAGPGLVLVGDWLSHEHATKLGECEGLSVSVIPHDR